MISEALDVIFVGGHKDFALGVRFVAVWRRNQEIGVLASRTATGTTGAKRIGHHRNEDHSDQQKDQRLQQRINKQ